MTQGTTPPGWYDDGNGAQRWWDGTGWTEHTQPLGTETAGPPDAPDAPAAPSGDVTQVRPPGQPHPAYGEQQPPAAPQQPAYGQQQPGQWQTPYPPAPGGATGATGGSKGRGKLFAIIGAAAAVVLIGAVLLVVLLGGGGGGAEGVAEDYLEAQADLDIQRVCELTAEGPQREQLESAEADDCAALGEQSNELFGEEERAYFDDVEIDVEIDDVQEDGDEATVEYSFTSEYTGDDEEGFKETFGTDVTEESDSGTLTMVKEDGDWKVSEDA